MNTHKAINGFFIIKTIPGNYIVGLNDDRYNDIHFNEREIWINNAVMIPISAIEYYKEKIPYREFIRTCEDAGIINRKDVLETLMDYYDSQRINPIYINYLRYMNDLRV